MKIRTQVNLTKDHVERLRLEANNKGISVSELLRRILDEYYIKGE